MYELYINGQKKEIEKNCKLIDYLRDDLNLTSVKNGCGEGACGACTILVDGKKLRACLLTIEQADHKNIITMEGLDPYEKKVYTYAFAKAGAVQCGFCIPGMVISAKSLLDQNLNPTELEIRQAIIGNICRCTGYQKIVEAIFLAAKCFRGEEEALLKEAQGRVGEASVRPDAESKILGEAKYTDDYEVDGMVYGSALRAAYPRALIRAIHIEKALSHPEVVKIALAEDIPGERFLGHLNQDWPAMIAVGEETRYLGDAVALVAAKTKAAVEEIKALIEVEYEVRTPVFDPEEAMQLTEYQIHKTGNILRQETIVRGDVDLALKESAYVVTDTYETPAQEHAFLEPESALAIPQGDQLTVYTGGQSIYDDFHAIQMMLAIPKEKLRVKSAYVGGGFGGKEDMSVQHHAALLAYLCGKPVKITMTRQESLRTHPKRHAMKMEMTTGCDKNGNLTAMRLRLISDTGAYASLGGPVLQRACTHASGPYHFDNVDIIGTAVYTNNVPAGAFRGFGVTQSAFACECNLNKLAELVGIDAYEIRIRNAIRPGQSLPNGQIADEGTALVETLEAVKDVYYNSGPFTGIACAFKNAGLGVGVPDTGRVNLKIIDGKVSLRTSASCIGQGIAATMTTICCETTGVPTSCIIVEMPDTDITPDSGTTTASRQTVVTGEATRRVSLQLKKALEDHALSELEGMEYFDSYTAVTDPMGSPKEHPVSHVAYGYATQVVILKEDGKVDKVVAAHDIGKAINPMNVEGQIEGGVVMGLSFALTEDMKLKDGIPSAKFGGMGLWRAVQVPEIKSILIEKNPSEIAYGAKGIGEITLVPTAPAVQNALYRKDGIFRTRLPFEHTAYRK